MSAPDERKRECPKGCKGEVVFRDDVVGDTCGGLTLRGWDECQACKTIFLAPKGMGVVHEAWRISAGGRSVETGDGRIRVDGCSDTAALMARLVRLPELELEVATLRRQIEERAAASEPAEEPTL